MSADESLPDIPGYRLIRQLGRGGMATVYLANQEKFDREVAIKVMDPEMLHDETFSRRFQRESQIVSKLNHPHIIQVYDVGLVGENHYLAMELITGGELNDRLEHGLDIKIAFRVTKEIARALEFAHSKGFIHRDIKPENILFREEGSTVLSDFGIARDVDGESQITTLGTVVGTPYYMSPEQVTGEKLDGRADLYSLGVVFYKMLTGKVPYDGDSALNIGIRHIKDPVPKLPASLSAMQPLIDSFMAKSPTKRFQSGADVVKALEKFEASNAMPRSVAKTEIIGADVIDEIKRRTGSGEDAAPANHPSVTRVMQVKTQKKSSPVPFLIAGVVAALAIGGVALFFLGGGGGEAVGDARTSSSSVATSGAPEAVSEPPGMAEPEPAVEEFDPAGASLSELIGQADLYRARGALVEPEGANALELYEEVLLRDDDNRTALTGMDAIGRSLAESGLVDLAEGRGELARARLARARDLSPDAQVVLQLADAVAERDARLDLIERAGEQLAAGRLTTPEGASAVDLMRRALETPPRMARAEPVREALVARLEAVAADARAFDMDDEAAPYERAARELAALR